MAAALLAAFADGSNVDAERHEVRRVVDSLGGDLNALQIYREVLFKRVDVGHVVAALKTPAAKLMAYESAVGVCDADALRNEAETRFLAGLGRALGLGLPAIAETAATADALATMPLAADHALEATGADNALEQSILHSAILAGALELLPQSMASLAIIPLQMKMIYRIGQAHEQPLDRAQITDLLATLGIGLTGQYIEQLARKLAGSVGGQFSRPAGGAVTAFVTTYALGHTARRYYAGGRVLSPSMLQQAFGDFLAQAKKLQAQFLPKIEATAGSVEVASIAALVREH